MRPAPFTYHRARSAPEAAQLLAGLGPAAKLIAGGQSLLPLMYARTLRPSALVDLGAVDELRRVQAHGAQLSVGALVTHRSLETAALPAAYGWMSRVARLVGPLPVRTRGTIGGSLVHDDPVGEWPAACLAAGARLSVTSGNGARERSLADLAPDEVVTHVHLPGSRPYVAVEEFTPRVVDRAAAVAAVAFSVVDGRASDTAVVVATQRGGRHRLADAGSHLDGQPVSGLPATAAAELSGLVREQVRRLVSRGADHGHLAALSAALVLRAVSAAMSQARGAGQ